MMSEHIERLIYPAHRHGTCYDSFRPLLLLTIPLHSLMRLHSLKFL
jgi:hypothetical protein